MIEHDEPGLAAHAELISCRKGEQGSRRLPLLLGGHPNLDVAAGALDLGDVGNRLGRPRGTTEGPHDDGDEYDHDQRDQILQDELRVSHDELRASVSEDSGPSRSTS